MASFRKLSRFYYLTNSLRCFSSTVQGSATGEVLNNVENKDQNNPVQMKNPYEKEKPKCILCKYNITPDFRNVRLLSQFISRHTGKVYGRHITGLCEHKQKQVEKEIIKARCCWLMFSKIKNPKFFGDPSLYNVNNPLRPHNYF
ncbi:conserved hypothetical protein [Pediculus humanus corporis]|uniref:28S ribosomal protein S18c, mitochondrial n=1 Tax=Pediculus humanus subsp. corporis TaxID=121224 RepID=E0W143_PEDHC|nr:uncharacterized protein Phum_PHUM569510 [Pediculus humanus corporis]EEB19349.1 conserved hypothetical protein [Pediculus humanus corporis]